MNGCEYILELFLSRWTFACWETGYWSQARATFHHGYVVKETPLLPIAHKYTHTVSTRPASWCSFFLAAWANNWPVSFSQSAWQPPVQGAVTPASDFSFRSFVGIMAHRGQYCTVTRACYSNCLLLLRTLVRVLDACEALSPEFIWGGFFSLWN